MRISWREVEGVNPVSNSSVTQRPGHLQLPMQEIGAGNLAFDHRLYTPLPTPFSFSVLW